MKTIETLRQKVQRNLSELLRTGFVLNSGYSDDYDGFTHLSVDGLVDYTIEEIMNEMYHEDLEENHFTDKRIKEIIFELA